MDFLASCKLTVTEMTEKKQLKNLRHYSTATYSNAHQSPPASTSTREFDLNIESILENWEVYHALRELIANAIDEQVATNTREISIFKENGCWHIVDYGRGLNYHHLTQNESCEKLNNDKLIGRFGVGLKDALATLHRHDIAVKITSKYGVITLTQAAKAGFEDIVTLHAKITCSNTPSLIGTDFSLCGCSDEDVNRAKSLFLSFSGDEVLESTHYGQVVKRSDNMATIYINGIKVADEPKFLFSYNITALTKQLKQALNRERTNVGRTAYSDRIKAILMASTSETVAHSLVQDLKQFGSGQTHDELLWNEIGLYASKKLHSLCSKTTFITTDTLENRPQIVDEMRRDGFIPVVVPATVVDKMEDYNKDANSVHALNTVTHYISNVELSFTPKIIDADNLSLSERLVFDKTSEILQLIGGKPSVVKTIEIAEVLYQGVYRNKTVGLWEPHQQRVLISQSQLRSIDSFAGTLLHECIHALSGMDDVSRDFEIELTNMIGVLAAQIVKRK